MLFSQEIVFFLGHFNKDKNRFIQPGIQLFCCKKQIRNRCFSQKIKFYNRAAQLTRLLSITACQFVKDKRKRHHFPRKQANTTKEHPRVSGKQVNLYQKTKFCRGAQSFSSRLTSISQAKRHILNRTRAFASDPSLDFYDLLLIQFI